MRLIKDMSETRAPYRENRYSEAIFTMTYVAFLLSARDGDGSGRNARVKPAFPELAVPGLPRFGARSSAIGAPALAVSPALPAGRPIPAAEPQQLRPLPGSDLPLPETTSMAGWTTISGRSGVIRTRDPLIPNQKSLANAG